nr:class I SAM-dependent methyltransferase [Paludisphaera mucosa]
MWAPRVAAAYLERVAPIDMASILDFGCGEGVMASGLATLCREVTGIDIVPTFWRLNEQLDSVFGPGHSVPRVDLRLVEPDEPLPFPDGRFDAAYAWSAFEHVADTPRALREIRRVLRPGGAFFLIITPLYYSAHGNHLWNVVDEPWVHLKLNREQLFRRVQDAVLKAEVDEGRTDVFQGNSAEAYRDSLYGCLDSLNGLTANQLKEHLRVAGFVIDHEETRCNHPSYEPPAELLARYPREDLMIDEIRLVMHV